MKFDKKIKLHININLLDKHNRLIAVIIYKSIPKS